METAIPTVPWRSSLFSYLSPTSWPSTASGATVESFQAAVDGASDAGQPLTLGLGSFSLDFSELLSTIDVTGDVEIVDAGTEATIIACGPEDPTFVYRRSPAGPAST